MGRICFVVALLFGCSSAVQAQETRRVFAGAVAGISTLSADGRAMTSPADAMLSLYKPENGPALNAFAGVHVWNFFSLQANYVWNRNDVTLVSAAVAPNGGSFYEQPRGSSQHMFVADSLLYFRRVGSRIRPYLGTGLAIFKFTSQPDAGGVANGVTAPAGRIASTKVGLRSHVGIDVAISRRVSFRYSFSETISGNPISPHLSPKGERGLANFQNLWGLIAHF